MTKINLGCGHVQPAGWINVDGSNRAWLASRLSWIDGGLTRLGLLPPTEFNRRTYFANINRRLPWKDESVDCVFLGEVLEHFTREDGLKLMQECHRILRPGGIIRLRVPDNAQFWRKYLTEFEATRGKPRSEWTADHDRWIELFFHDICVRKTHFASYGHYHKWMYDEVTLILMMEKIGFVNVARRKLHDSEISGIEQVETFEYLTVEAKKAGGTKTGSNY